MSKPNKILLIGCLGQIGQELVPALRAAYGEDKVIGADIKRASGALRGEKIRYIDLTTPSMLNQMIVEDGVDWIIHNASILSAVGEQNPELAMRVNFHHLNTVFDVCRSHPRMRLFVPSSISAFGPTTPAINTPNSTIQRPTTIYGVSKVYAELMGSYYGSRVPGFDFRCLRYPGIISATEPGGGTTDWAVDIFKHAVLYGRYEGCFLSRETTLPMMYMPDCLKATLQMMDVAESDLRSRVYNVTCMSLAPKHLEEEIRKYIPGFEVTYVEKDFRQRIADSWPRSIDDSEARSDWGWSPDYDVGKMTRHMLVAMKARMNAEGKQTVPLQNLKN